jgi:8-amino-7-oxononanoate synthase
MSDTNAKLSAALNKRSQAGNKRTLSIPNGDLIDFCSNDYLGFARSLELKDRIVARYSAITVKNGSTGSRLLTGNTDLAESTEQLLANFFGVAGCLTFNSGYSANLGFFSTIPKRGDTILYDELSHACIKDGCRLSLAKSFPFKHNDTIDLEKKILKAEGKVFIACESVYSMNGDLAPINELANLSEKHNANLVVDEAHSTGVFGQNGTGLVAEYGLTERVFAIIFTFGKALGIHGACIASSNEVKEYLINFARPFIYTTAPSNFDFISIEQALLALTNEQNERVERLNQNIGYFKSQLDIKRPSQYDSPTAIQVVLTPGNFTTRKAANELVHKGFDVRPILSPTVREGEERLRICLHSFNTENDISAMAKCLNSLLCH